MPGSTEPVLDVRVHGTPAPQGSKDPWGGEANRRTKPWREQVADALGRAFGDTPVLRGPVKCVVVFAFTRPKSHYRTGKNAHLLREDAPHFHTAPNDTDKLQRAIGDALTGVAWHDDKQVAWWDARKIYDERAYAHITIFELLPGGQHDSGRGAAATEGASPGAADHHGSQGARTATD